MFFFFFFLAIRKRFRCWKVTGDVELFFFFSRLNLRGNTVAAVRTVKEKVIDVDAIDSSSIQ